MRGETVEEHIFVPTTHQSPHGVTDGVVQILQKLYRNDVQQIAYATTQVTNALLEGDLSSTALLLYAPSLLAQLYFTLLKPPTLTAGGKSFRPLRKILTSEKELPKTLAELAGKVEALCISTLFPYREAEEALARETRQVLPTTFGSQISSLYGFSARTRTALLNASLLPVQSANIRFLTEALRTMGIERNLLVLRSDGGALNIEAAREKPLLTLLSGPAAGVAAASQFLKVYQGIFVESGGTSTDISRIENGKPRKALACVGSHLLHFRTLDIHTVGIAGGSLPRFRHGKLAAVGPRSAHIAGLSYASLTPVEIIQESRIFTISPRPGDPSEYLAFGVQNPTWALTPSCCENFLRIQRGETPLFGEVESILASVQKAEKLLGCKELASSILHRAAHDLAQEIAAFRTGEELELIGGGGSAPVFIPRIAEELNLPFSIAPHYTVISAIGAALAVLKESLERQVPALTEDEISRAKQALAKVFQGKGLPAPSEYEIEVDPVRKKIYIAAMMSRPQVGQEKRHTQNGELVFNGQLVKTYRLRSSDPSQKTRQMLATDLQGNALFTGAAIGVLELSSKDLSPVRRRLEALAVYDDAGVHYPTLYLFFQGKLVKIAPSSKETMLALCGAQLENVSENYAALFLS